MDGAADQQHHEVVGALVEDSVVDGPRFRHAARMPVRRRQEGPP